MVESEKKSRSRKDPDLSQMFNPENVGNFLRLLLAEGQGSSFSSLIDTLNIKADGGHLMQMAIYKKDAEIVKALIAKGIDLKSPPQTIPPVRTYKTMHEDYRKTPFVIQAACAGDVGIMKLLIYAGCSLNDCGHIALSRRRRHSIVTNVIGAATYWGRDEMLLYCIKNLPQDFIDFKASECNDRTQSKAGPMKHEVHEFTALQLAMVTPHQNLKVVRILFDKSDRQVKESHTENTIVHLAAKNSQDSIEVLEYVVKNQKNDDNIIFERNKAGDTAMSIVVASKNQKAIDMLEEVQAEHDDSGKKTDELMAELLGEDEKNERARLKKREKKHRSKLQKLADKNSCTIAQLEEVFKNQEEQKRQEERDREMAQQAAELEAEQSAQREMERRHAAYEAERAEELAALEAERAEQRKKDEAEQILKRAKHAEKMIKLQKEQELASKTQQNSNVKTQSTNSITKKQQKKMDYRERKRYEQEKIQETSDLKEEVPDQNTDALTTPAESKVPKILGLTGDLALQNMSKKERKKHLEEEKQREIERQQMKEKILQAKVEQQAAKKQKEKEDRLEAQRLRKKQEEQKRLEEQTEAKQEQHEYDRQQKEFKKQKTKDRKKQKKNERQAAAATTTEIKTNMELKIEDAQKNGQLSPVAVAELIFSAEPSAQEQAKTTKQQRRREKKSNEAKNEEQSQAMAPNELTKQVSFESSKKPKPQKRAEKNKEAKMVYMPKVRTNVEEAQQSQASLEVKERESTELTNYQQVKQKDAVQDQDDSYRLEKILAEMQQKLHKALIEATEARKSQKEAEQRSERIQNNLAAQMQSNEELKQQLHEQQQDNGAMSSLNERELQKQIKQLTSKLQQQQNANKSLSAKLMREEKAVADEKQARIDLEKRLNTALQSRPPAGPNQMSTPSGDDQNELDQIQYSLQQVNQRVQHSLGKR